MCVLVCVCEGGVLVHMRGCVCVCVCVYVVFVFVFVCVRVVCVV